MMVVELRKLASMCSDKFEERSLINPVKSNTERESAI